jgi:Domain of unknown function (DUF5655)
MESQAHSVEQHFSKSQPRVRAIYNQLLEITTRFGPIREEPKKTSIHLVNRTAFAGVATRKDSLILTVKAASDLTHARIILAGFFTLAARGVEKFGSAMRELQRRSRISICSVIP